MSGGNSASASACNHLLDAGLEQAPGPLFGHGRAKHGAVGAVGPPELKLVAMLILMVAILELYGCNARAGRNLVVRVVAVAEQLAA